MPNRLPANLAGAYDEPVGYAALIRQFELTCLPYWHVGFISTAHKRETHHLPDKRVVEAYPPGRRPTTPGAVGHLVFAIRHEGVSLEILKATFERMDPDELTAAVRDKPTSEYLRRLWFFYEWLLDRRLDLPDITSGRYTHAFPPDAYITHPNPTRSRRHYVWNNGLGSAEWCPIVRRAGLPDASAVEALAAKLATSLQEVDDDLLARAVAYLYTKETKSSYLIEREEPGITRQERFVALLRSADAHGPPTAKDLVHLQQVTVDPRFAENGWRDDEVYVGETLPDFSERVHYVAPKANNVSAMMDACLAMAADLANPLAVAPDPVTAAAIISFSFVYIHPFSDGNGRLHRFLIHQVLSLRGFTPRGAVLPISTVILKDRRGYDDCLEHISRPLLELLSYELDGDGVMTIHGETADHYRYLDLTDQVACLHAWVERTITDELETELRLLEQWDQVTARMMEIADLPDRKRDLFIRCCRQNGGQLSETKRRNQFSELTDAEIEALTAALSEVFK